MGSHLYCWFLFILEVFPKYFSILTVQKFNIGFFFFGGGGRDRDLFWFREFLGFASSLRDFFGGGGGGGGNDSVCFSPSPEYTPGSHMTFHVC